MRTRPLATGALVAWTFLVWTFRIGTIWSDDEASTGSQVFRTALALTFTGLAVVVAWRLWRGTPGLRAPVLALAVLTTVVWFVRVPAIAWADHDAAFVVVHTVLAVVSVGLAFAAAREVRRPVPVGSRATSRR